MLLTILVALAASLTSMAQGPAAPPVGTAREFTTDLDRDGVTEQCRLESSADGLLSLTLGGPDDLGRWSLGLCWIGLLDDDAPPPRLGDLDGDGYDDLVAGEQLLVPGYVLLRSWQARDRVYAPIWNSGGDLRNVWDAEVDDLDQDGHRELMAQSYHYPGTLVHLYECDGNDSFALTWHGDTLSTPSLNSICGGDTDRDGLREAIAGEVGTLGRVYLWECVGDNAFEYRPLDISMQPYDGAIKDVLVEDGDLDGRLEIVVCTGSAGDGSAVALFEHSGAVGENVYSEVYAYETVSYLFGIESGDSDNDGDREILLNVGGGVGYPMYLRRLEYNPVLLTYEHKMIQPGPIGLPLSAAVGDVDGDAYNELVIGAGVPAGGAIYVFESLADDLYALAWSSDFEIPGTPQDVSLGPLNEYGYPTIAVSSFEGQIDIVGYDGVSYVRHLEPPLQLGGAVRSVDHTLADDPDLREDLVLAVSGDDRVYVYERTDLAAVRPPDRITTPGLGLVACPNPFRTATRLSLAADPAGILGPLRLGLYDAAGRRLRTLAAGDPVGGRVAVAWDGRGNDGSPVPSGTYYLRVENRRGMFTAPLVCVR